MTADTSDVAWLDQQQQRSWRAFLVGTTLLMDRLDRDLREQHRISLPEYEILVRLSEADGHRLRMAMLADSVSHSRSRVTHTVTRMETRRPGRPGRLPLRRPRRRGGAHRAGPRAAGGRRARPTWPASAEFLVDLVDDDDFEAVGRVFDAVTDRLIEANPAMDIR